MRSAIALGIALISLPLALFSGPIQAEVSQLTTQSVNASLPGLFAPLPHWRNGAQSQGSIRLQYQISNIFTSHTTQGESSLFDHETEISSLQIDGHIQPGIKVYLDLEHIRHRPGHLDALIHQWHEFFGLPQGGRDEQPRKQLLLSYLDESGRAQSFSTRATRSGWGNLRAGLTYQMASLGGLWAQLELLAPLGRSSRLTTAERQKISLGLGQEHTLRDLQPGILLLWSAGLSAYSQGEGPWQERARQWRASGRFAIHLEWMAGHLAFAQLDLASPGYNSNLEELNAAPVQLLLGWRSRLDRHWSLEAALGEDLNTTASPDLTLQASVNYLWRPD